MTTRNSLRPVTFEGSLSVSAGKLAEALQKLSYVEIWKGVALAFLLVAFHVEENDDSFQR